MLIVGNVSMKASREEVFRGLLDADILSKAIPGCEKIIIKGEHEYETTMNLGIGVVKGRYTGNIRLVDINPPHSYVMLIQGDGGIMGNVEGESKIALQDEGEAATTITYEIDTRVNGKLAAVGSRFLGMISKVMIGKFFKDVAIQIEGRRAS